ncbi:MAG: hypothetical protein IJM82_06890 [Synergistaceae bacterium]|nr:hypothetical protein [Synergistaceae bacterium]
MRVYIPFDDGSSISFDGENFTIHKRPNDIDSIDSPEYNKPSKAENAWNFRWEELVRALQNAHKKQETAKKLSRNKMIYKP